MKKHRWSLEVSLERLRESRPWVRPNDGFMKQLREEEYKMGLGIGRSRFWAGLIEKNDLYKVMDGKN